MPGRAQRRRTSDRARSVGGILCIALVAVGVWAATLASPKVGAQAVTSASSIQVRANDAVGRDLYVATCAACHGPQGAGTNVAPDITHAGPALTDFVLRTGRMPLPDLNAPSVRRTPILTEEQIVALVGYVSSLGSGPPIPQVVISGADMALGRDLFIANCAACHGAAGTGDAVGGGFVAPNLREADPLTVAEAVTSGPGPMPVFQFTQSELNAVAAYVQGLGTMAAPGGLTIAEVGPVPEGFVAGVFGLLTLLILARWIGRPRPSPLAPIADGQVGVSDPGPGPAAERTSDTGSGGDDEARHGPA